jgi:glycosyltransferase involved in cell wall biosynthesis
VRALKIAWCHHGDSGGSKRAAFEMVRELSRRGHLIDEFIIRDGPPNLEHFPMHAHVRRTSTTRLGAPRQRIRPYFLAAWLAALEEVARGPGNRAVFRGLASEMHREGYDLVHVDQMAQCLATGLLPFLEIPSIVYSHEASRARYETNGNERGAHRRGPSVMVSEWGIETSRWIRDRRDRRNTRQASIVLTNSEFSRDIYLSRYGGAATICPYGVDTDTFRPLELLRENLVLSVGRLVEAKQHHLAIEAIGQLALGQRPRLVIATPEWKDRLEDPAYHGRLRSSAEAHGVTLEIIHDPPQQDLVKLYNRAAALVFAPRMEPFGLVALEAMACGAPVIGVPEGGVRESVREGVSGFLVPRDAAAIAERLRYLLTDPEAGRRIGTLAVRYVREEWTWSRTIDRYEVHAGNLLETRGHAA